MRSPSRHGAAGSVPRLHIGSRAVHGLLVLTIAFAGCARDDEADPAIEQTGGEAAAVASAFDVTAEPMDSIIFEEKVEWAQQNGIADMPIGDALAALGRTFVGTDYVPGALEVEGAERLIINLRGLDCVTFIENTLAIVRIVQAGNPTYDAFKRELVRIRYRDGILNGYASRLHYFSEWIANNAEKGLVEDVTLQVGGVQDTGAITFMTRHMDAYRQLEDPANVDEIRAIELELSGRERFYIPETEIAAAAGNIRDGDIIAATSTLEGLDIAHTGFALWVDGRLHLMHAPLVGSVVEISELPLADRIQRIEAQDGIMVARAVEGT